MVEAEARDRAAGPEMGLRRLLKEANRWLTPGDVPWMAAALVEASCRHWAPLPLQLRLAAAQGRLRHRTALSAYERNVRIALGALIPEAEVRAIAQRYAGFRYQYALLARPRLPGKDHLARCPVDGLHHLAWALARGRGAILVSAHFGYVSALPYVLLGKGYEVWQLRARSSKRRSAERREARGYSKLKRRLYKRFYGEPGSVSWDRVIIADFNVRPLVQALQANKLLNLLGDGTNSSRRLPVTMLGRTFYLAAGYINVALRNGSPVLPVFVVEDGQHGLRVVIEEPLKLGRAGNLAGDLQDGVQQFASVWERYILRWPHLLPGHNDLGWLEKLEREPAAESSAD